MIVSGSRFFTGLKKRPSRYKARDAAYPTGGNKGSYIAWLPREYPKNKPQRIITALAKECGIKPGMSKAELQKIMKECITSEKYKEVAGKVS